MIISGRPGNKQAASSPTVIILKYNLNTHNCEKECHRDCQRKSESVLHDKENFEFGMRKYIFIYINLYI